jgi:hypothetical protein
MITILYRPNPQAYFHAFFPLLQSPHSDALTFTDNIRFCLEKDRNEVLVVMGIFKGNYDAEDQNIALLNSLKKKYRKLVFLDDSDGADSLHVELIAHVDLYYKKQLLADRSQYLKPAYGRQHFSEYYRQRYGLSDPRPDNRAALEQPELLSKLRLFWNIGAAAYPKQKWKRKVAFILSGPPFKMLKNPFYPRLSEIPKNLAPKKKAIQVRFGYAAYTPSIGFQRKLMLENLTGINGLMTGRISQADYNQEMKKILAVLSPFGWGEICHRDFEAFHFGSLLMKPDCSHMQTWPDVFRSGETYLPIDWGMEGLAAACGLVLEQPTYYRSLAAEGQQHYLNQLKEMPQQVEAFITELLA